MVIKTKFGNAGINDRGYYRIVSSKEGNCNKKLHILNWEDHYGIKVPKGYVIHHIDHNPLNWNINNLQCVKRSMHSRYHQINVKRTEKSKQKQSKKQNKTGYFRVYKVKAIRYKQGFIYVYQYYDENKKRKSISSVNIKKLEQKVKEKDLKWIKFE